LQKSAVAEATFHIKDSNEVRTRIAVAIPKKTQSLHWMGHPKWPILSSALLKKSAVAAPIFALPGKAEPTAILTT
jgi:hypothetical protein